MSLELVDRTGTTVQYCLGPHTPTLRPEDVQLMHAIWLDLTKDLEFSGLHHYHVVALALRELQLQLKTGAREELLQELSHDVLGITNSASNGNDKSITNENRL